MEDDDDLDRDSGPPDQHDDNDFGHCGDGIFSLCRWECEGGAVFLAIAYCSAGTGWRLLPAPCAILMTDKLDRTDTLYPLQCWETVQSLRLVEAAQAELLYPNGSIKDSCKGKVMSYIIYYII